VQASTALPLAVTLLVRKFIRPTKDLARPDDDFTIVGTRG
jgi:hypothetical protein